MAGLSDLLADPLASIHVVVAISYLSSSSVESTEWVSQDGWTDPPNGPVGIYIPPLLETGIQISQHVDPLNLQESFGTYAQIILLNDFSDPIYRGRYDGWHRISIDDRSIKYYLVGTLSNGTRVNLADVITTPLFDLRGIEIPEVGDAKVILNVRDDSHSLDSAIQPVTYSPPCLAFPGTLNGSVDFGDVLDQTSSFSISGWVYLEDPTVGFQYIFFKLSGATGYSLDVGAQITLTVGAQSPASTSATAGILHSRFWHFISISVNTATGAREIGVDGASVATSAGVTGSPNANAIALKWGIGLRGKLSRWTYYNSARTVAAMWAEARTPILPTASGLLAHFPPDEGVGTTIHDRKSGSSITGTAGTGVVWDTANWHLPSIVGAYRPFVLGTVPRVPVTWIDPAAQIGEVSYGGCSLISEVQSNHNALGAIWSPNLPAGTLQVTSGALSGTYSATVTANNFWGSAVQVASTSTVLASISIPTGSCTLCVQYTPSKSYSASGNRAIIGWLLPSTVSSLITLRLDPSSGANRLAAHCTNNSSTVFTCPTVYNLKEGRTYSLALRLDTSALTLSIHVDGESVASVPVTGAFTTASSQFGVGCRGDGGASTQAEGRYDEPLVFLRALTQDEIRALHLLPATGSESGLVYGWHMDDAAGGTAASMLAGTALTLTNTSWVSGRSSAADLARKTLYLSGYVAADLDTTSWRQCLNLNPSDCGWCVGSGETALVLLRLILCGLGFVPYKILSKIYIRQFVGLTGISDATYSPTSTIRQGEISPESHDTPVWQWQILYAHNNTRLDAANIAGALASSDPDRYAYGQIDDRIATKSDYSIVRLASGANGRFPSAVNKTRQTALLNIRDAEDESARLLTLHRYGSDTKSIPLWILAGNNAFLHESTFDVPECELDLSTWIMIGVECQDDEVTAVIWRPASPTYLGVARETDAGDYRVADDGNTRVED